jgi:hypothetical protein
VYVSFLFVIFTYFFCLFQGHHQDTPRFIHGANGRAMQLVPGNYTPKSFLCLYSDVSLFPLIKIGSTKFAISFAYNLKSGS